MAEQLREIRLLLGNPSTTTTVATATAAAITVLAVYWWSSKKKVQEKGEIDLNNQSIEVEPGVRTSHDAPDGKLTAYYFSDAQTLYETFLRGLRVSGNGRCLGSRTGPNLEYEWLSYQQVLDKAHAFGSGLKQLGIEYGPEHMIGIYAQNRPEWVITQYGCIMFSTVLVPLYDTLGKDACAYVMNQTEMQLVVVDTSAKVEALLDAAPKLPQLKTLVVMDTISNNNVQSGEKVGVKVISFNEVLEMGKKDLQNPIPPKPDDPVTICYTSGTTGNPKGVVLTHKNIVSNISAVRLVIKVKLTNQDAHLSYLPLAHMMEGTVQAMCMLNGMRIGFFRGDVKLLMEDLQALKPTVFPTVPRLLNRIYDKVMAGVASGSAAKRLIFNIALKRKMALLEKGIVTRTSIWDKLVFGKIQTLLGGNVQYVVTGSAPLADNVLQFIRCAFGCLVAEGYGQTECNAAMTFTLPNETKAGHVGPPVPCCMIKLADVPEMEYFAKDNKGEVCCKGNNVMSHYYKEPGKTAEAIDEEGWLHSGDIGMWLPNGALKIIDRKKHIFKLAQGEYIAPEKIENVYVRSPLVAQCFVDGSSLQSCTLAVAVPDPETLPSWAEKNGLKGSIAELCQNKKVKEEILSQMLAEGKRAKLKGFEQVKDVFLFPELFSVENGLLTPTFKSKRPQLRQYFKKQFDDMYAKMS